MVWYTSANIYHKKNAAKLVYTHLVKNIPNQEAYPEERISTSHPGPASRGNSPNSHDFDFRLGIIQLHRVVSTASSCRGLGLVSQSAELLDLRFLGLDFTWRGGSRWWKGPGSGGGGAWMGLSRDGWMEGRMGFIRVFSDQPR